MQRYQNVISRLKYVLLYWEHGHHVASASKERGLDVVLCVCSVVPEVQFINVGLTQAT